MNRTVWGCLVICVFAVNNLVGQEFRIETQVYVGDQNSPSAQNVTIFSDGMIYDFQMSHDAEPMPLEISIFNSQDKSFELIDVQRGVRLSLQQVQLFQMVEGLRQQTSQKELTKFLVEDQFNEDADLSEGIVTLTSDNIEYRFEGKKPADVAILPPYFDFLDQFTRLNATDPSKLPPFPRIRLNQAIKKYGWFPSKISARLLKNDLFREDVQLRSEHTLVSTLSDQDRARIKDAKRHWMQTKSVGLADYRQLKSPSRVAKLRTIGRTNKGVDAPTKGGQ